MADFTFHERKTWAELFAAFPDGHGGSVIQGYLDDQAKRGYTLVSSSCSGADLHFFFRRDPPPAKATK